MTMSARETTTKRPGSLHDGEPADVETLTGQLLAAVAKAEEVTKRVEAAARGMRHEQETYTRTVVQLSKSVDELQAAQTLMLDAQTSLLNAQKRTHRTVVWSRNLAPFVLGALELLRQLLTAHGWHLP